MFCCPIVINSIKSYSTNYTVKFIDLHRYTFQFNSKPFAIFNWNVFSALFNVNSNSWKTATDSHTNSLEHISNITENYLKFEPLFRFKLLIQSVLNAQLS